MDILDTSSKLSSASAICSNIIVIFAFVTISKVQSSNVNVSVDAKVRNVIFFQNTFIEELVQVAKRFNGFKVQ